MSFGNERYNWFKPRTKSKAERRRGRRDSVSGANGALCGDAGIRLPRIEDIASVGNIVCVFEHAKKHAGQATGLDHVSFKDVGNSEAIAVFREFSKRILEGSYRPQPERRVMIPRPNKSDRPLDIGCVCDRVVAAAAAQALAPYFEAMFSDISYAYRIGRSTLGMLARLTALAEAHNLWVAGNNDIQQAYPSMPLGAVLTAFAEYIADPRLLGFISAIIHGSEGVSKTRGLAQGCSFSTLALNVLLNMILDSLYGRDQYEPPLLRYSDNLVLLCRSAIESRMARTRLEEFLTPHGLHLKPETLEGERTHADLRAGETTQLLGFVLSMRGGKMDFDIGPERWTRLRESLQECHLHPDSLHRARQVLSGWITGAAPALSRWRSAFTTSMVMVITKEMGFREIHEKTVRGLVVHAHEQWVDVLSLTPSDAPGPHDAAAAATATGSFS